MLQATSSRFRRSSLADLLTTILACAITMPSVAHASPLGSKDNLTVGDRYHAQIDNPPRLQWGPNFGYCGEVSMISAGLRYGQYLSQYEARAIASNNTPQNEPGSQLLLGDNAIWAASQMLLKAEPYQSNNGPDSQNFLTWVKNGILANSSVIMAIYTNEYLFYDKKNPTSGDPQYDHIVPVIGISSSFPLSTKSTYHSNDTITFSDNGLWAPHNKPTYIWQYDQGTFQASRKQANAHNGAVYSLPDKVRNFGLLVSGIIDTDGQTLPVHLATNVNSEMPSIKRDSNTRPPPEKLILTITVESLQPGEEYNLYRYDNFSSVPESSFNAKSSQAAQSWRIHANATSYSFTQSIMSDDIVVYRAVPANAP